MTPFFTMHKGVERMDSNLDAQVRIDRMNVALDAQERANHILNVEEHNVPLLTELTQIQTELLTEKLGMEVPSNLVFIVVETTIARYRKVGAEGMDSKGLDIISNDYSEDIFAPYLDIIAKYSIKDISTKKIVRLI